jgi:hypothetical protein
MQIFPAIAEKGHYQGREACLPRSVGEQAHRNLEKCPLHIFVRDQQKLLNGLPGFTESTSPYNIKLNRSTANIRNELATPYMFQLIVANFRIK